MESQPLSPEFRCNPENFHPCTCSDFKMVIIKEGNKKCHKHVTHAPKGIGLA